MPHPDTLQDLITLAGDGFGQACRIYGLNPLHGRLYMALFLSVQPVSLPELTRQLGVAKSTASVSVRQLLAFGLVKRVNKPGDRRDYYVIVDDPMSVLSHVLRNHVTAEIQEGMKVVDVLQGGLAQPGGEGWPEEEELAILRERTEALTLLTHASAAIVSQLLQGPTPLDTERLIEVLGGAIDQLRAAPDLTQDDPTTPAAPSTRQEPTP